jgi:glycosyltransferase involved in cell wall biosynthesis
MEISSCLIVKNGGDNFINLLHQLLEFSSEVIIVDTGSDEENFKKYSAVQDERLKIYLFEWIDDFAKARNYSFSKATKEWIFWCDADDVLTDDLINTLKNMSVGELFNSVIINYDFSNGYFVPRKRLLRKSAVPIWYDRVHEYVSCQLSGGELDLSDLKYGYIKHEHRDGPHTERNLRIYRDMISKGESMTSRNWLYYGNELFDAGNMEEAYEAYNTALDSLYNFDAWNALIKMYDIDESRNNLDYWLGRALFISSKMEMRGDVCYLIGISYLNKGDKDQGQAWLARALDVDANGLEAFGEDIYKSKYLPAKVLWNIFIKDGKDEQAKIMEELITRFIDEYKLDVEKLEPLKIDYNAST